MDIQTLASNISQFVASYDNVERAFYEQCKPLFVDANSDALDVGEDSEGNKLPEYRNPQYAQLKRSRGSKSGGHWDWKLTGESRSKMVMRSDGFITSLDDKTDKLVRFAGGEVFGVQQKRFDELVQDQLIPDFIGIIENKILK